MSSGSSWFDSFESGEGDDDTALDVGELRAVEYSSRDAVVFLVDAHLPMIQLSNPQQHTLLQFTIKAIAASYKAKIIESPDDLLGICFYGTNDTQNINGFQGIFVWSDLQEPNPNTIMKLEHIAKDSQKTKQFVQEDLGGALDPSLGAEAEFSKALWICSTMFAEIQKKNVTKRIFCFTYNDSPNKSNMAAQQQAFQKMSDLRDLNIMFDLFPVQPPFYSSKFFNRIVTVPSDEFNGNFDVESSSGFEDLTKRIKHKRHKKRALISCFIRIGNNFNIGVKAYCLINKTRKGSPTWLDSRTNQQLSIETKYLCEYSGQVLENHEMKKFYPYGDAKVNFDQSQIDMIKTIPIGNLDDPSEAKSGITLIGFKPRSALEEWHNIKQTYFIYPDETSVKGSESILKALIEEMSAMEKIAIAWFVTRARASIPRLVALLPQKECVDEEGYTSEPGGLHVVFLPFADDIREVNQEPLEEELDDKLVEAARKLISIGTTGGYEVLPNPALQHHYAVLQALALNLPEAEKVEDVAEPDPEFLSMYESLHEEFAQLLYGEGVDFENPDGASNAASKKRKAAPAGNSRSRGKKALDHDGADDDEPAKKKSGRGRGRDRGGARGGRKAVISSESEDDDKPVPKRGGRGRKAKAAIVSDSEDDAEPVSKRGRGVRGRKRLSIVMLLLYWSRRQPLPDYRTLMVLMLLPVICIIVYYSAHHYDSIPDQGIVPLITTNTDINTPTNIIMAVPFESGPKHFQTMYNVTIQHQPNREGQACHTDKFNVKGTKLTLDAVLIENWMLCFPEDVAAAAKELDFDIVLYQSPFKVAGYSALSFWRKNTAPIPIMEINYKDPIASISLANISPSSNPYSTSANYNVMIFLSVICAFFGALQVWVAVIKLMDLGGIKTLNTKVLVCILQVLSGVLRIIFSIDLCGFHHTISYPVFFILLSLGLILVFATVFLVAFAFHFAILAVRKTKVTDNKPFWGLSAIVIILVGVSLYGAGISATLRPGYTVFIMVNASIAAIFQIVSGIYFVYSKQKVVNMLSASSGNRQAARAREVKRMSVYLYLAMVPMLGFLASMGLYGERYFNRSPQIISLTLAAIVSALTELTLICSFPVKQRGRDTPAPTEAGSMELQQREGGPKMAHRISSHTSDV